MNRIKPTLFSYKPSTLGHIARLAGSPNRKLKFHAALLQPCLTLYYTVTQSLLTDSRLVGQALKFLQADDVPWQRVISSSGAISDRGDGGAGARRQAERLIQGEPRSRGSRLYYADPLRLISAFFTRGGRGL